MLIKEFEDQKIRKSDQKIRIVLRLNWKLKNFTKDRKSDFNKLCRIKGKTVHPIVHRFTRYFNFEGSSNFSRAYCA